MIPSDGRIPSKEKASDLVAAAAAAQAAQAELPQTYEAAPQPFVGLSGELKAPFAVTSMVAPLLKGDAVPTASGKQPVYHLKITARPLKKLNEGQSLTYKVTAGPTGGDLTGGLTETQTVKPPGTVVHCVPEMADQSPLQFASPAEAAAAAAAAGYGPAGSAGLTGPGGPGGSQSWTAPRLSKSSSYHDQLSGITGLHNLNFKTIAHVYKGEAALGTDAVVGGLLAAPGASRAGEGLVDSSDETVGVPGWWNKSSKSMADMSVKEKEEMAAQYEDLAEVNRIQYGRHRSRSSRGEGMSATEFRQKLGLVPGGMPPPPEPGFSKVIPDLVDPEDAEKHSVYNWIVPDEAVEAELDRLSSSFSGVGQDARGPRARFQRGNTADIMDVMRRTRAAALGQGAAEKGLFWRRLFPQKREDGTDEPGFPAGGEDPLHFMTSGQLEHFLQEAHAGLLWEQGRLPEELANLASGPASVQSRLAHNPQAHAGRKLTGPLTSLLNWLGCGPGAGAGADEKTSGRENLGRNLDVEDYSSDEEEPPIRPSVVYGGVEHEPPRFVGELGPLTMRLHAAETHQYFPVAGMSHPWFLKTGLNPASQAVHGPVALPWDPKNTGMPAPTVQSLFRRGYVKVDLAPAVADMFEPELPNATTTQVAPADETTA
ncbi:hypothetical protein GNI_169970 [Gregarina niphandrodes]|uniref:Uncharacterized protein n=1 Tax=Gregarina niphandrodes TaxID=110365 RepID=A0A023AXW3_GRENI|nr:hypothetical protein GNI_169970 [Gregarina niphandrodes]EZG43496.1 hypothetical protein GNI_169970 [Gregarina niphandrodes]|eukprot:XP_011133278.1 hypothetical protein GNI_169970 [Gregarina niphandrodes]